MDAKLLADVVPPEDNALQLLRVVPPQDWHATEILQLLADFIFSLTCIAASTFTQEGRLAAVAQTRNVLNHGLTRVCNGQEAYE